MIVSSWNINRGLIKKQAEIEEILFQNDMALLALQETDLTDYSDKNPIVIAGYRTISHMNNPKNNKNRMLVFVRNDLNITVRDDLMSDSFCSIWIEVHLKKTLLLGFFYRNGM